ncbi:MAG TPA: CHAD domain-containing protein [Myxococcales bacterium]|nr:CHAD domain-containing protein [Myxococcales bacterium]
MTKPSKVAGLDAGTQLRIAAELLLHARVADLHAAEARALRSFDPDSVHDLRVACRRVRAAIKVFGKKRLRSLDERVEHLQDVLGEVRDLQLRIRWLVRHQADPRAVRARLGVAKAHLRKALALWTRRSEVLLLREAVHVHGRGHLGGSRVRQRLRKRVRELQRELSQADSLEPACAHRVRIAAKKLRYEAELLSDAFDLADAVEVLSDAQSALGDLHDADVRLQEVRADGRLTQVARAERRRSATKARAALRRLGRVASVLEERV